MTPPTTTAAEPPGVTWPDHTQLPCEDGRVHNPEEHPQSELLTGCLLPRLSQLHPDGRFFVGCDVGIYWSVTQPPLDGRAPDWFFVPNVPALLEGKRRRSYVMWHEIVRPLIVVEYVSGDGSEERDATERKGKFWVYEQAIGAAYYAIHDPEKEGGPVIELYEQVRGRYCLVAPNAAGRYPIERLGVELGLWQAKFRGTDWPWLRAWDSATGEMLPHPEERAEMERRRAEAAEGLIDDFRREVDEVSELAETERKRAEVAARRAEQLADRLRALGVDPDPA